RNLYTVLLSARASVEAGGACSCPPRGFQLSARHSQRQLVQVPGVTVVSHRRGTWQSERAEQCCPARQREQASLPPQSTSVSKPFWRPSRHSLPRQVSFCASQRKVVQSALVLQR